VRLREQAVNKSEHTKKMISEARARPPRPLRNQPPARLLAALAADRVHAVLLWPQDFRGFRALQDVVDELEARIWDNIEDMVVVAQDQPAVLVRTMEARGTALVRASPA
jgi:hypothetical protein